MVISLDMQRKLSTKAREFDNRDTFDIYVRLGGHNEMKSVYFLPQPYLSFGASVIAVFIVTFTLHKLIKIKKMSFSLSIVKTG